MIEKLNLTKKDFDLIKFINVNLIIFLPISLLIGSGVINLTIIIFDLLFLIDIFKKKKIHFLNNNIFYALLLFWISLIINSAFSSNFENSIPRVIGFFRFIILVNGISFYLNINDNQYSKIVFKIWSFLFLIVLFDLLFEFIFGFNVLGNVSYIPGRLSSFLGDELKIGNYFFGFILITIVFFHNTFKKISITYFLIFLFLIVAFLIGERSNFIKIFIMLLLFSFLLHKKHFIRLLIFYFVSFSILITTAMLNDNYKSRFWEMLGEPLKKDLNLFTTLKNSPYGAHYDAAIKIFQKNKIFGVGIKNFRNESHNKDYENKEFVFYEFRSSTHPHQIHFEFLSETGLFGYLTFLLFYIYSLIVFYKNQKNYINLYQLSGALFLITVIIPFLPSGSFFTTYSATIFWINYAIMISPNHLVNND